MVKPTGPTNPELRKLIDELRKKSYEIGSPFLCTLADKLEKPRRKRIEVNLSRIQRYARENEIIVVPGVVLGDGEIKKPVIIAAWKFSKASKEKIEKCGGKAISIRELVNENPFGSNVRIMC